MKIKIVALFIVAALATHPINHKIVAEINSKQTSWTAMTPEENPLSHLTVDEIKMMLGTHIVETPEVLSNFDTTISADDIPENFRYENEFNKVKDQGSCGSCWAFGAAGALSDRYHKVSGLDINLSEQHLVDCDTSLNMGCNGGYIFMVWRYLESQGIVTDACYPYVSGKTQVGGKCQTACTDGKAFDRKYKCAGASSHPGSADAIKKEIFVNGVAELAFTVYQDFMSYKSGVYQHVTGNQLGGHAVKVIGFGVEDGLNYWLCQNSWASTWGEGGYFKIL
jgi:cathepsin B